MLRQDYKLTLSSVLCADMRGFACCRSRECCRIVKILNGVQVQLPLDDELRTDNFNYESGNVYLFELV